MTCEEKLDKIVEKLKEERDLTREGHKTKVTFTDKSFTKVRIQETCKILLQLKDDEGVVEIIDALQPVETVLAEQILSPSDDDNYEGVEIIIVEVGEDFDDWYISYVLQQKSQPKNLDWLNLLKVLDVCDDIDKQLQITGKPDLSIESFPYPYIGRFIELFPQDNIGTRKSYQQYRWEGTQYLCKEGIALEVEYENNDALGYGAIKIKVDLSKFVGFYKKLQEEYKKRFETNSKSDPKRTIHKSREKPKARDDSYVITYTKQRQILLNNNAEIGKPDFNSENDLVFSFLYEHPNETFTKGQLEKAIGSTLTKSLHKIIENLGFEGDIKKAFFSVSKNAVQFRNPVTREQLKEMRSPLIKTIKGGGKIVLLD